MFNIYLPIILSFILTILVIILPMYLIKLKFNKSRYSNETGTSFFKIFFDKGIYGEFLTFVELEKIKDNSLVMANLYIPKDNNETTEIDLLLIHKTGLYVVESKNYSGWIYGSEKQKKWTQVLSNKQKNYFYNPIWQNNGHIKALRDVLRFENEYIFNSYIVFSERCKLKKVNYSKDTVTIVKRNSLYNELKKDLSETKEIFTTDIIMTIYAILNKYSMANNEVKTKHISDIKRKNNVI